MKIKKILLSLFLASSLAAVSFSASALSDPGRIAYAPGDAIDLVLGKIKAALDAAGQGTEGADLGGKIKEALDASKEINANDKVDVARSRANNKLKSAKKHANEGRTQEALGDLQEASKMFQNLKKLL